MRVLLFSHILPPAVDGGSKIIHTLGIYLEKQGHQTKYLGSNCQSTDDFTKHRFLFRACRKLGLPVGPYFSLKEFVNLIYAIHRFHPDWIISGPLPTTIALYTRLFQLIFRTKVLFVPCYHESDPAFSKGYFLKILPNFHLWTFTNHESNLLKPYSSKIIQQFPGVDSVFFHKTKKQSHHRLLFLGNLAAHKGIIPLIQALEFLPPKYTLTIAGQKTLFYPKIEAYLSNPRVSVVLKKYNQQEESHLLDSHDILVLPSTQESFGLVLAEAMARNTPIVCIDIPTTRELISASKSGILAKTQNPKDIANAILQIKNQSGYDFAKKYLTWDNVTKNLCNYLQSH